ncbi:MAG: flagellar motor protein MotB [Chromatiales bacterium]|nr:flagellar motor protein MotB [Gammaproteobacteria bacterium]MBW6476274.1 flagellar motor protein MotB [Chromatiales bacterium]
MAIDEKKRPIVIKRIKKVAGGHHGGAWKIAYADFVTAMMAFFLLMWLLGSTSTEERAAIADYFQNPSAIPGAGGASTSMIKLGGALELPRGDGEPLRDPAIQQALETQAVEQSQSIDELIEEKLKLDELMEQLREQIENTPSLADFKDQLLLDITSEGLRIQIVDKRNRPMFDLGSAELRYYTSEILRELAKTLATVPNHLSISGHTDSTPFLGVRPNYTNWELSSDRANAARRELYAGGVPVKKFGRVVGLADSVHFNKSEPNAPINRRISIVVLNRATERAIGLVEANSPANSPTAPPVSAPGAGPAGAAAPPAAAIIPAPAAPAGVFPPSDQELEEALSRALRQ